MGRSLRQYSDSGMYFVTTRTFQGRLLLRPSAEVNAAVGGVLAKAVARYGVELHAYVVLSNHVHLLVSTKGAQLSAFMQYFAGNTARKAGRLAQWAGGFWQRRFSAEPVLDDEAAEGRLRYILSHGVKEGLVRHPAEWPGLSCLKLLREGGCERHRFFHWARRRNSGTLVEGGADPWSPALAEEIELELTPLPHWSGLSPVERRLRVDAIVNEIVREGETAHLHVLGVESIRRLHSHRIQSPPKKGRAPLCHTSSPALRTEYRRARAAWRGQYRAASQALREGTSPLPFPRWAFRPTFLSRADSTAPATQPRSRSDVVVPSATSDGDGALAA
jgi:REP element-mobilizing transposase RayT